MRNFVANNIFPILATAAIVLGTLFAVRRSRVDIEESNGEESKTTQNSHTQDLPKTEVIDSPPKSKREKQLDEAPVLVAYGSQTGNAMVIAQEVYEKLGRRGISANLSELNSWKKWKHALQNTKYALFVISTTGNGDPPDNCAKFYRYLRKKDLSNNFLEDLNYSVLALGDTNYDKFCEMGKWLQARLAALSGKSMMPLAMADDGTGLEDVVEPWMKNVVTTVRQRVKGHYKPQDPSPLASEEPAKKGASSDELKEGACEFKQESSNFEVVRVAPKTLRKPIRDSLSIPDIVKLRNLSSFEACMGIEAAKQVAKHALEAEASCFYKVVGLGLYEVSLEYPDQQDVSSESKQPAEVEDDGGECSYALQVQKVRYLTKGGQQSSRRVIHAELSGCPHYRVGDAIGVHCENLEEDVLSTFQALRRGDEELASKMELESKVCLHMTRTGEKASLPAGCAKSKASVCIAKQCSAASKSLEKFKDCERDSVFGLLKYGLDLASCPKPQLCAALAATCPDDSKDKGYLLALALKEHDKGPNRRFSSFAIKDIEDEVDKKEAEEKAVASPYEKFVIGQQLKVAELLALFPSCRPSLSLLIGLVPPLSTRYYSISSSPLFIQQQASYSSGKGCDKEGAPLTIAFGVERWEGTSSENQSLKTIPRYGLCTNWFEQNFMKFMDLNESPHNQSKRCTLMVEADMRPCTDFTLPDDANTPVVMIGGGTGVVPFVGFIQHRQALKREAKYASIVSSSSNGQKGSASDFNRESRTSENSPVSSCSGTPRLADIPGSMALYFGYALFVHFRVAENYYYLKIFGCLG